MNYVISTDIRGFSYWIKTEYILNREGVANPKHINFYFTGLKNNATEFKDYQLAEKHRILIQPKTKNNLTVVESR